MVLGGMLLVCRMFAVSGSRKIGSKSRREWILLCKLIYDAAASGGKVTLSNVNSAQ